MLTDEIAMQMFYFAGALTAYNTIGYPRLLQAIAHRPPVAAGPTGAIGGEPPPTLTIIVPVYNEERHIARKVENTLALSYDPARLRIVFAFDGCTDRSVEIANAVLADLGQADRIEVRRHEVNSGKVAVLNEEIGRTTSEIVLLTDVSALLPADALLSLVSGFADAEVGVVCPAYAGAGTGSADTGSADQSYWRAQTRLKRMESDVAAPIGPHGACYLFRRRLWTPLPTDTINDDFVMPMRIVAQGSSAIYDDSVVVQEMEPTSARVEFRRRLRIGAGNLQQVLRVPQLASLTRPRLAFLFLSGKGLRAFVPLLALTAAIAAIYLAARGVAPFGLIALGLALVFALVAACQFGAERFLPRPLGVLNYIVTGLVASALGSLMLMAGFAGGLWKSSNVNKGES